MRVDRIGLGGGLDRLEPQVAVVARRAVDHRVPGAGQLADPLERRDRQVAVRRLGRLEDPEHVLGIVVELLEDRVERGEVDRREPTVRGIRHGPPGAAERGFLASFAVGLGGAPMDVEAAPGVDPAHVDALDRAGLGALEAGLALERAPLVVEQLETAAELGRRLDPHLGVHDRDLRLEEAAERERHALRDAEARHEAHQAGLTVRKTTIAAAVTNRLSRDAGSIHFQAKSMSWSIRTRGSVPRIHTKMNTNA